MFEFDDCKGAILRRCFHTAEYGIGYALIA